MVIIHKEELRKGFQRIIDKLEHDNFEKIEIDTDFYRFIPTDEWGNFSKDIIVVGSLYDDAESFKMMINDKERPCTYVDFDRIASLLRAVSNEINPPTLPHL